MLGDKLRQFMAGRYGIDPLGVCTLVLYLIFHLLALLFNGPILHLLSLAAFVVTVYRMFSRKFILRQQENQRFMSVAGPLIRRLRVLNCRRKDKEHAYFKCPGCGQQLRAPKGKGKIHVTCRSCGASFDEKT